MSLAEQIQRVDGGQNDILKAFLAAFGVTVGSNKIDQLAEFAKAAPLLKENGILAEGTKTSFGLAADATVDDVLKKLSKAALSDSSGGLVTPGGTQIQFSKIESGEYTGTGKGGASNPPNSFSFSFTPKVVIVCPLEQNLGDYMTMFGCVPWAYEQTAGVSAISSTSVVLCKLTWSANTISWVMNNGDDAKSQLNENGKKYKVVALS